MNRRTITILVLSLGLSSGAAAEQVLEDAAGTRDLEGLPRVSSTVIVGYEFSEYDVAAFVKGKANRFSPEVVDAEGERQRYIYAGTPTQTPLQLVRNYQQAFRAFGEFEQVYECADKDCPTNLVGNVIWPEDNRMRVQMPGGGNFAFRYPMHSQPHYFYARVDRAGARYHVSAFAMQTRVRAPVSAEIPILHLDVVKEEGFSDDLEFVTSSQMRDSVERTGSVALYGLQFEFDSAGLTDASDATIAEIAAFLEEDPDLAVFVVGHTDDQGALDYNERLSGERAAAVVRALVTRYGIDPGRLSSRGIGPLAPIASNATEAGRARNRRVEIVRR